MTIIQKTVQEIGGGTLAAAGDDQHPARGGTYSLSLGGVPACRDGVSRRLRQTAD